MGGEPFAGVDDELFVGFDGDVVGGVLRIEVEGFVVVGD